MTDKSHENVVEDQRVMGPVAVGVQRSFRVADMVAT
jgi:hypothetical protein